MSQDIIQSKIDLIQEQIDNLERSGFFTEKEMDRATVSLKQEKEYFEKQLINEA